MTLALLALYRIAIEFRLVDVEIRLVFIGENFEWHRVAALITR